MNLLFSVTLIINSVIKAIRDAEKSFIKEIISKYMPLNENLQEVPQNRMFDSVVQAMDPPVDGSNDFGFQSYFSPGIVLSNIYFMTMGITAVIFVLESNSGLLERSLLTGLKMREIIISQVFIQLIMIICQTILMIAMLFYVFNVPNSGYIWDIILIVFLQGIAGMGFG